MSDIFIQLILALLGALIGIGAVLIKKKTWLKRIAWILAVLLIVVAAMWFTYSLVQKPETTEVKVTVHVADNKGASIPNAKVLTFFPQGSFSQYTDNDGITTFNLTPSKTESRLIVEADDYQIYERQIRSSNDSTIDIRLKQQEGNTADIILRAVDETDNTPISGVEIKLITQGDILRKTTDSDGFAQYELVFPKEGKVDAEISVNAKGYKIENQISTLLPGKLQYVLLTSDTLRVEIPNIPPIEGSSSGQATTTPSENVKIGSGVEITNVNNGSGLRVIQLGPDGQPWENVYVRVNEQKTDASGNPSQGDKIGDGSINRQGQFDIELGEGTYVVCTNQAPGYGWMTDECIYNVNIQTGKLTIVRLQVGRLEIGVAYADGSPWKGVYYQIFTERQDVSGNPVTDKRVADGGTDNTGIGSAWLTPGQYAVSIDLRGYNWGNLSEAKGEINIPVQKGNVARVHLQMGRLVVGLRKPDGSPNAGAYAQIFTQRPDINGRPIFADRVWDGTTDAAGLANIDLTQGKYCIKVGDNFLYDIPVVWGKVTMTDGSSFK
jgi:hypothetical protein